MRKIRLGTESATRHGPEPRPPVFLGETDAEPSGKRLPIWPCPIRRRHNGRPEPVHRNATALASFVEALVPLAVEIQGRGPGLPLIAGAE